MQVQPYLFFDGRCEEAIEFYRRALNAEVEMLMRFQEAPERPPPGTVPPGSENKVMHASIRIGDTTVMASDGHCAGKPAFQGFSLSLTVQDTAEAERRFAAPGRFLAEILFNFDRPGEQFGLVIVHLLPGLASMERTKPAA